MKSKLVQLGVLSGVLVVLIVALLLVWQRPVEPEAYEGSADEAEAESEAITLYSLGGPVKTLRVTPSGGETYTLANLAETLEEHEAEPSRTLLELEDLPLYYSKIENALGDAESLEALYLVVSSASDYGEFGLAEPAALIEVEAYSGERHTLRIGNPAPAGDGYYAAIDDDPAVYLLSNSIAAAYLGEATTYMTTLLTPGSYAQFRELTLGGRVREELGEVVIRATGEETESTADYRIVSPVDQPLGSSDALVAISSLFGFYSLDILELYPDEARLAEYGLSEPYYATATVISDELGDFTLIAAQPLQSDIVFVKLEHIPVVYAAEREDMPWLELQYYDLMERRALPHVVLDVAEIAVRTQTAETVFTVSATEDEEAPTGVVAEVFAGEREIDGEFFLNYYHTLVSANLDEYTEDQPDPDEEPAVTVRFRLRDGSESAVSFYAADASRRSFIQPEGERAYYTSAGYVNRLLDDLDRLLAGEVVQAWAG